MYFSFIFVFFSCSEEEPFWGTTSNTPKTYDFYPAGDSVWYLYYLNPDGFTDKRYLEIHLDMSHEDRYPEKTAILILKKADGSLKNITEASRDTVIRNYVKYLPFSPQDGDTILLFLYDGIHKPHPDIWMDPPDKQIVLKF